MVRFPFVPGEPRRYTDKSMNSLLDKTLSAIERESPDFDESFALAACLVEEVGGHDIAIRLLPQIPPDVKWEVIADLYGILIWSVDDKSAELLVRTLEKWLIDHSDVRRIRIALNCDIVPFRNRSDMDSALQTIKNVYPELTGEVDSFLNTCSDSSLFQKEPFENTLATYALLVLGIAIALAVIEAFRHLVV